MQIMSTSPVSLRPAHPGTRLQRLLKERGITAYRCAADIDVPKPRVYELVKGLSSVTPPMALRLGVYFGDGPEIWMAEQARFDLARQQAELKADLAAIRPLPLLAAS